MRNRIIVAAFVSSLTLVLSGCASTDDGQPVALNSASGWNGKPVVRVESGLLRGHDDREGSLVWRGIPYAAPPIGTLRWQPPQAPKAWSGIRDAGAFGGWAVQRAPFFGFSMGSEDCLYLNVWRPKGPKAGLPVYVYIHGGGNTAGASNLIDDYLGWAVAARSGLVFVSINYRLGPMGWFADPSILAGASGEGRSGNFGTLDIIAALRWVKDNIGAFGGDPSRVTVAGESAGALNVLSLLLSPPASGLFSRAIVESGYNGFTTRVDAEKASEQLFESILVRKGKAKKADAAQVAATMPAAERAAIFRSTSAGEMVSLLADGGFGMTKWPSAIIDGGVIPAGGLDAFARGDWPNKVPLIIGSNKEETKLFLSGNPRLDWKTPAYAAIARFGSLEWKAVGVDSIADAIASHPEAPPVYVYRFDWGAPDATGKSPEPGDWGRKLGAFHSIEVSFFLGTGTCLGPLYTWQLFTDKNRPGREKLSAGIMAYLKAFAETGIPRADGLQTWEHRPANAQAAAAGGSPVGIVFDATATTPAFEALTEVATKESIKEAMARELDPAMVAEVEKSFIVR